MCGRVIVFESKLLFPELTANIPLHPSRSSREVAVFAGSLAMYTHDIHPDFTNPAEGHTKESESLGEPTEGSTNGSIRQVEGQEPLPRR